MLELNPDSVRHIMDMAREFHAQEAVALPEEEPDRFDTHWAADVLADVEEESYSELKDAINDLEPDQQVTLVALVWLGRGDYDVEEWEQALSDAGDAWNERTAEYLMATPLLADYLAEGLAAHGYGTG
jgi:hypothetical protein